MLEVVNIAIAKRNERTNQWGKAVLSGNRASALSASGGQRKLMRVLLQYIIVIKEPEITFKEVLTCNLNGNQNLKHLHFVSAYN